MTLAALDKMAEGFGVKIEDENFLDTLAQETRTQQKRKGKANQVGFIAAYRVSPPFRVGNQ